MRKLTAIACGFALATTAWTQPNPADFDLPEPESDRLYHIEVILYAFNEGNRFEEDFLHGVDNPRIGPPPELLRLPDIELQSVFDFRPQPIAEPIVDSQASQPDAVAPGQELTVLPTEAPAEETDTLTDRLELFALDSAGERQPAGAAGRVPEGFRPLTGTELELVAEAARMNRRPYTLLGHAGWLQTGVDTDRSVRLDLKHLGISNPSGTVEVYARRYLHVAVDLNFFDGSGTRWRPGVGFGPVPFEYAQSYRINEEINGIASRSGQLHGIDHPLFGVLVRITPAPEPEDDTAAESSGRPAG